MKTKKYLFLMLAAALLTACGDDDDSDKSKQNNQEQKGGGGQKEDEKKNPTVIDFADYSSTIGMTYSNMIRQYPDPVMQFSDFYMYENRDNGKTAGLTIAINPDSKTVYLVIQQLAENAYAEGDIVAYMNSKYTSYGTEQRDVYDDNDSIIGKVTAYQFGNTAKEEEATLVIELLGNQSVSYINPKDVPAEPEGGDLGNITPEEAVNKFLLQNIEDILAEYPDVFMDMNGMYAAFMEENEWLMGVAIVPVEGYVINVVLLFNEDFSDEDIIKYYTDRGYTSENMGKDEEGRDTYTFTKGNISIGYCENRGVATFMGELD